jgi:predicted transcriptional regulator
MADDGFSVRIDDDLAEDVKAAAAAKGIPVEVFVRDALAHHIFAEVEWSDDPDPEVDMRIAEEAIQTGDTLDWADAREWVKTWGKADEAAPPKWPKSD